MDKKERLIEVLESLRVAELVAVHNRYCEECNYPDDEIYDMDSFEEYIGEIEPMRLVNMVYYGGFNPTDNYWWFDGNGNLASGDYPESSYGGQQIYISDIASAMICEESGFGCDECQEILDEDEEDEDE